MQDLNAAGAAAMPHRPAPKKGRSAIDHAARQIVTLLTEVHRMPLGFLDTVANPDACA